VLIIKSQWATAAVLVSAAGAAGQTGTFLDRAAPTDVRIASFNTAPDNIFPDDDAVQAAKFQRLVIALDADIWALQEVYRPWAAAEVKALMDSYVPIGGAGWQVYQGDDNVIASKYPLSEERELIPDANVGQAIALVDLPDAHFPTDLYLFNNHYPCCDGNDPNRQQQSDAIMDYWRDIRNGQGSVSLPTDTGMMVIGDLNIVDGNQPLNTLINGDIQDHTLFGPDQAPDWDGTDLADAHPLHNTLGPEDYTWRNDLSIYEPGRLDFALYTDSVFDVSHSFVLNTAEMTAQELAATGLLAGDVTLNLAQGRFDHLPLILDLRAVPGPVLGDLDGDGFVGLDDLDLILNNWNQTVPPGDPLADPTDDNYVGLEDLDVVLHNWNAGTPPGPGLNIPEPATWSVLVISFAVLNRRRP